MEQFIVLGLIPGTHLQITFTWLVIVGLLAMGWGTRHLQGLLEQDNN